MAFKCLWYGGSSEQWCEGFRTFGDAVGITFLNRKPAERNCGLPAQLAHWVLVGKKAIHYVVIIQGLYSLIPTYSLLTTSTSEIRTTVRVGLQLKGKSATETLNVQVPKIRIFRPTYVGLLCTKYIIYTSTSTALVGKLMIWVFLKLEVPSWGLYN